MSRHAFDDPTPVLLAGLALICTLVFLYGFRYSELTAKILPLAVLGILLLLLLVPQKNLSMVLTTGMILSIPFAHFAVFIAIGEGIQVAHIFGIALIIHLVVRLLLGKSLPVAPATPWVILLLFATLISTYAVINEPAVHLTEFYKSEIQFVFVVLLFLAVTQLRLSSRNLLFLLQAMIVLSVLVALFGIYQLPARFFSLPFAVIRLTNPSLSGQLHVVTLIHHLTRASSIFSEPSYFGHYMVSMLALSLTAAFHNPRLFGSRLTMWLIIAVQAMGFVLCQAMSAFYIFAQLILVMLFMERWFVRRKILGTIITIIVLGITAMYVIEQVSGYPILKGLFERIFGIYRYVLGDRSYLIEGESAFMRVDTAKIALDVWKDHPVIGVGVGSYTLVSSRYGEWNPFGFAANTLVNSLAETGIIGFVAFIGVGLASLNGLWRIFRMERPDAQDKVLRGTGNRDLTLIARMVFYLILVQFLYFHVVGSFYWLSTWIYFGLGGLVAVISANSNNSTERT